MDRRVIIVLVIVGAAIFFFGAPAVVRAIRDKEIIGDNPKEDAKGGIAESPTSLLASANAELRAAGEPQIDINEYALARSLRSEHGSEPAAVRTWVAWAIRNGANRSGKSVFKKLTDSRSRTYSGRFARQRTDARFAATNRAPNFGDVRIARQVLNASKSSDPTDGATNFFSPRAQDALFARAQEGDPAVVGRITRDADAQRERWLNQGLESKGTPPGVSPRTVEFFGRAA